MARPMAPVWAWAMIATSATGIYGEGGGATRFIPIYIINMCMLREDWAFRMAKALRHLHPASLRLLNIGFIFLWHDFCNAIE